MTEYSETPTADDLGAVERLRSGYDGIRDELRKVIVGQDDVIEQLLIAMFAGGHCILEGVPGLAKTLLISTLAKSLSLTFSRIQFTPDLMPSDITGTEVIQEDKATGARTFKFLRGPVFANVILADEINRTPPKTQAALLEAMQEKQVTVGGTQHNLTPPFFVLATQNPIEQEGTYPLPEAQQDRFMFKVFVGYPSYDEELQIAELSSTDVESARDSIPKVLDAEAVLSLQSLVRRVPVAQQVVRHALDLVRNTRPHEEKTPAIIKRMVTWGAGPRAVQYLVLAAKARAVLHGRHHVAVDDVRAIAHPILRHRIVTNFSAEAEGYSRDRIIDELLNETIPNQSALAQDERIENVLES